jgi:hypothetical protein
VRYRTRRFPRPEAGRHHRNLRRPRDFEELTTPVVNN